MQWTNGVSRDGGGGGLCVAPGLARCRRALGPVCRGAWQEDWQDGGLGLARGRGGMCPLSPNRKASPGMFSVNHLEVLTAHRCPPLAGPPRPGPLGTWGALTGQQLWKRSRRKPTHVPGTSPLFSGCENPIKQLEPHVTLLLRRAGVCALLSIISAKIRVPPCSCGRR